jgi:hypothetical protein
MSRFILLSTVAIAACKQKPASDSIPGTADTGSGEEPNVLPIDTSVFIPQDTGATGPPNLTPSNYVLMNQIGVWNMQQAGPPYGDMSGSMRITEYIDELDTALPVYECDVRYTLNGSIVDNHDCNDCEFVYAVEYYVNSGDPSTCHDPDAPQHEQTLELGFVSDNEGIQYNYMGTDVWKHWYDAQKSGATVNFEWIATLAIEVVDTGSTQ